jgi:hypothetical protein
VTGSFMPSEGFQQQQAADLDARRTQGIPTPNPAAPIPAPSTSAVSNLESRATSAMPTGPQNQVAQTAERVANIHEAGATERHKMQLAPFDMGPSAGAGAGTGTGADLKNAPAMIQALVERRADPRLLMSRKWTPEMQNQVLAEVQKYDPQFNMADYASQYKAKQAFTSGPQGQNVTSINTAMRHLKALDNGLTKLDNTRFPIVNTALNATMRELGGEQTQEGMATVQKEADAVATELSRAFRGSSVMSEKDITEWRKGLGTSTTPAQQRGAIKGAVELLAGRIAEMNSSYQRSVGRPLDMNLFGEARNILKSMKLDADFGANDTGAGTGTGTGAAPAPTPAPGGASFDYVPGKGLVPSASQSGVRP